MNRNRQLLGLGGLALLFVSQGCSPLATASSDTPKYDFAALDQYVGDAKSQEHWALTSKKADVPPTSYDGFYGHWVAKIDVEKEMQKEAAQRKADPNADPQMEKMGEEFGKAMASALASMLTMDLDINKDGTFKLAIMGMPMEGDWKQDAMVLTLTPTKFMGMTSEQFAKESGKPVPDNKPMLLQISPDGTTLIARDPSGKSGEVFEFKRA